VLVKPSDIVIGTAIEWDVFDISGVLLAAKGNVLKNEEEKATLLGRKPFRDQEIPPSEFAPPPSLSQSSLAPKKSPPPPPPPPPDPRAKKKIESRLPFEEAHVQPGDVLQLQATGESERFLVHIVGYLKGKSVIVTNPVLDGAPMYVRNGSSFVARSFSGKLAFAFPATVMSSSMNPYPYLHLNYPSEVHGVAVRVAERVTIRVIAAFECEDGSKGAGIIVDLSFSGCLLVSRATNLVIGKPIILKFKVMVAEVEYVQEIKSIVRSCRPYDDDISMGMAYGIQFVALTPAENLVVSAFVYQQLAEFKLS
jgi:hypothetical protein